jgi:arylsulfatase A-like enzyme
MNRVGWLVVVWIATLAAGVSADEMSRPNVLMIAVDDLNHWVGYLGRNRQTSTPNIDRLARRGVRFERSYCAAPVCNPSRAALLSGLRPSTSGVYGNNDDWRRVIPIDQTLPTTLRRAGYLVAGAGKIYHTAYTRPEEWDEYPPDVDRDPKPEGDRGVGGIKFAPLDCDDDAMRDAATVRFGVEQLSKQHDRPFFLAIGLHKPHMPWNVPRKYYDLHPLDSIELPPTKAGDLDDLPAMGVKFAGARGDHADILASGRWKDAVQGYLAAISFCDAMIGRLLEALDASAYRENTIIVFWGDHGWHLGEKEHWRKFALWEEATRAPLIWVVPGVTQPNSVCRRTVDFMSIYPTLCELTGITTPAHVEGKSIRTLLSEPDASWEMPALTTHEKDNHAVRSEGWRYIRYADGGEELYDEAADPYEWTNLAKNAELAAVRRDLQRHLPINSAADASDTGLAKKVKRGAKQDE